VFTRISNAIDIFKKYCADQLRNNWNFDLVGSAISYPRPDDVDILATLNPSNKNKTNAFSQLYRKLVELHEKLGYQIFLSRAPCNVISEKMIFHIFVEEDENLSLSSRATAMVWFRTKQSISKSFEDHPKTSAKITWNYEIRKAIKFLLDWKVEAWTFVGKEGHIKNNIYYLTPPQKLRLLRHAAILAGLSYWNTTDANLFPCRNDLIFRLGFPVLPRDDEKTYIELLKDNIYRNCYLHIAYLALNKALLNCKKSKRNS
jgi:hypothetical protein